MPIYAFECASCGHEFERLQRLADADPTECPVCGAEQVRRQLTAPSFRLSGSGWYETDFKKDSDKKRNLTEKSDSSSAGGSAASGGSESKPDAKPETKPDAKPAAKAEPKAESKPAAKPATPGASGS